MKIYKPKTSKTFCAWKPDPNYGFQLLRADTHTYWIFYGTEYLGLAERRTDKRLRWSVLHHNEDGWYHHFPTLLKAAQFLLIETRVIEPKEQV